MALSSLFRRKDKPAAPAPAPAKGAPPVETLRLRARRRLIGAVVLLGIGIIAFPLLFETAPRPIPVNLPIEIPRKDAVAPLPVPASAPARIASAPAVAPLPARAEAPVSDPVPPPAPKPEPESKPVAKAEPAEKAPDKSAAEEAARARALLEGRAQAAAPSGERWVVQIGAFAEDKTVRDVRAKAGKIGLTTFTQVVAVEAGERTRVRVGPFNGRAEADAVAAKLKQAGLPASVVKP